MEIFCIAKSVWGCQLCHFVCNVCLSKNCAWHPACDVVLFSSPLSSDMYWVWLMIDSLWGFMYSGNSVDVCWQLSLVGDGKDTALLSLFFFNSFSLCKASHCGPLTGYAMQNAWAALCRVKLCVRVHCLQLKFCVWDSALCGWAVARSLPRSVSLFHCRSVFLSLWGCWRWQKWNALPVLRVKLPCWWISCAMHTV